MHQGFEDEKGMAPASTRRLATRQTPPAPGHQPCAGVFVCEAVECAGHNCQTQARVPREFQRDISGSSFPPHPQWRFDASFLDRFRTARTHARMQAVFRRRSTSGVAEKRETRPPADPRETQRPRCYFAPPPSAKLGCLGEVDWEARRRVQYSRESLRRIVWRSPLGPPHQQTADAGGQAKQNAPAGVHGCLPARGVWRELAPCRIE